MTGKHWLHSFERRAWICPQMFLMPSIHLQQILGGEVASSVISLSATIDITVQRTCNAGERCGIPLPAGKVRGDH